MSFKLGFILLCCLLINTYGRHSQGFVEIQRHFEFENVLRDDQWPYWVWRSEASDVKTLRLVDSVGIHRVEIEICIEPTNGERNVVLSLDDIRYSNDGPSDVIFVTFNGMAWGKYVTKEKWAYGHDWNIFRNTGRIGNTLLLQQGRYVIGITVNTDKYGLELDKIRLNAEYQDLNSPLFCGGVLLKE